MTVSGSRAAGTGWEEEGGGGWVADDGGGRDEEGMVEVGEVSGETAAWERSGILGFDDASDDEGAVVLAGGRLASP